VKKNIQEIQEKVHLLSIKEGALIMSGKIEEAKVIAQKIDELIMKVLKGGE